MFGDIRNKRLLEIGCGNGRSLKYVFDKIASELWGMDISLMQIKRTKEYLTSCGINANLVCSSMEIECVCQKNILNLSMLLAGQRL